MKTKMSTKVISAILAIVLTFSCSIQAFAADGYKATYTEKTTKKVYSTILEDANKLLGDAALTGQTIQSIYAIVPGLKSFIPEANKAAFYKNADSEIFANLDETAEVTTESLNAYFKENPVVVKDNADFAAKMKKIVNAVVTENVCTTIIFVIAIGGSMTPSIGDAKIGEFVGHIDGAFKALGVEQPISLADIILAGEDVDNATKRQNLVNYINNIIDGILPDVSHNVVGIIKNIADDKNNALLYNSVSKFFPMLLDMVKALEPMIGSFVPGLDLTPIKQPIANIVDAINSLPTVGEGDAKMFDLEGTIAYLVNDVLAAQIAGKRMDIISFGEGGNGVLKFDKFNKSNLVNAEDKTDAFNVIFNYLYNNLNKDANKEVLLNVLPLVPTIAPQVPQDVIDYLTFMLNNSKEDSVFELYALLRIATGNSSDMSELEPAKPVVPEPTDPEPVEPSEPTDPVEPAEPDTTTPNTDNDTDTNNNSDVKSPNTGAVEESTSATMYVMITTALGLVFVALVAKKRISNNA